MSFTSGFDEAQHPRSGDGKWTAKGYSEADGGPETILSAQGRVPHGQIPASRDLPVEVDQITHADPEQLWEIVEHPDWRVRMYAPTAINLTTEQMKVLADPATQPVPVRMAVAALSNPGVAARAASDPNPLVRQQALAFGWDLPAHTRQALHSDPEVAAVNKTLPAGVI